LPRFPLPSRPDKPGAPDLRVPNGLLKVAKRLIRRRFPHSGAGVTAPILIESAETVPAYTDSFLLHGMLSFSQLAQQFERLASGGRVERGRSPAVRSFIPFAAFCSALCGDLASTRTWSAMKILPFLIAPVSRTATREGDRSWDAGHDLPPTCACRLWRSGCRLWFSMVGM
jgi:hypothetical protein